MISGEHGFIGCECAALRERVGELVRPERRQQPRSERLRSSLSFVSVWGTKRATRYAEHRRDTVETAVSWPLRGG
jgi:hypothetical protein